MEVADQPILIPLGSTGILHRFLWDIDPLIDFRKPVCKIIEAFILPVNCHHIQENIGQRAKISGSEFFFYPRTYPVYALGGNARDRFPIGLNHQMYGEVTGKGGEYIVGINDGISTGHGG